jgi:hypothetical protein
MTTKTIGKPMIKTSWCSSCLDNQCIIAIGANASAVRLASLRIDVLLFGADRKVKNRAMLVTVVKTTVRIKHAHQQIRYPKLI